MKVQEVRTSVDFSERRRDAAPFIRRKLALLAVLVIANASGSHAAGTWTSLTQVAPETINTMLSLPDGTVMAAGGANNTWYRLTPDSQGSYVNGTWSALATMNYTRLYYSSDVLTNGCVFVAGGEYGSGANSAEVYDPISNTWTVVPPIAGTRFIDSISEMLPSGNVLIAPVSPFPSGSTVIYHPASNSLTTGPTLYRGTYQAEASWVKLPDDSILTIDPYGTYSERYIPSLNQWINDANVPVQMYDSYDDEIGAAFLLPDGRAFFLGGTGNTAIYSPSGNTNQGVWQAGPVIPNNQTTLDAPGAMMVNGNILCAVTSGSTGSGNYPAITSFYEYDPVANAFTQVNGPTGATYPGAAYAMRMLDLPDGTVLLSTPSSQLFVYQPGGSPLAAGKPIINSLLQNADGSFHLSGTQLNGISEGAAYGDDAQMSGNYPLVRLTNSGSGNVYYARTYNWSSTGVMTGNKVVTTEFTLPPGLPPANYSLVVVANGNSSDPLSFSTLTSRPVIATQPRSQTTTEGTTINFSVVAVGSQLSYFWLQNGAYVDGATNSTYAIENVQLANSNTLVSCLVSNLNGTTLSGSALLTVVSGIPTITMQPSAETVATVGNSASFAISAAGTAPLHYFWRRDNAIVSGAANFIYTIDNLQLSDSGARFSCLVSNKYGTVLSSNVLLSVVNGSLEVITFDDLGSGSPLPGNYHGFSWSNFLSLNGASYGGGYQAGTVSPPNVLLNDSGANAAVSQTNRFSLYSAYLTAAWSDNLQLQVLGYNGAALAFSNTYTLSATNPTFISFDYTNVTEVNFSSFGGTDHLDYLQTGTQFALDNLTLVIPGLPTPPVITRQPEDQFAVLGSNATFIVSALGEPPLRYQWQFLGSNILGATGVSYTVSGITMADTGNYRVVVTNDYGSVTSRLAGLSFLLTPVVGAYGNLPVVFFPMGGKTNYVVLMTTNLTSGNWVTVTDGIPFSGLTLEEFSGNAFLRLVAEANPVTRIAAGSAHSLFLKLDGSLWAMGYNADGELGDGTYDNINVPEQIVASNVTTIVAGTFHSLFLKNDGSLWGMGANDAGALGDGTYITTNRPQLIITSNVTAIAAGNGYSLFIKGDGSLWGMGDDGYGELGDATFNNANLPKLIVAADVTAIAAGGRHSLFLKSNGSLWAMGGNQYGDLGDGTYNQANFPEQIAASNVVAIAGGGGHTLFLKNDGSLWAMGINYDGELGNGTYNQTNLPELIVASNVTTIAAGGGHSLFLKSDGSLWGMGSNHNGQLGGFNNNPLNLPNQIVAGNVMAIAAGGGHSLFLKSDGSLWAMGANDSGALGDGSVTQTNLPQRIVAGYFLPQFLPQLDIGIYSNQPVVLFPAIPTAINYGLMLTTNLSSGNWVVVSNGIPFTGLQITNAPNPVFFRIY